MMLRRVLASSFAALAIAACSGDSGRDAPPPIADTEAGAITAPLHGTIPSNPPEFAPSAMRITARDPAVRVDEVESCASCHADVAAQWQTSVHAFASFDNPIYRASVLRFRSVAGTTKSRFCGGCHDLSLMVDGKMDGAISPTDARAHAGVTCRMCHGIEATRTDGNASFDLRIGAIEVPKEGDPESVQRHKIAAAPKPLRTAALCSSCHRAFLDESTGNAHHLGTQDEAGSWQRSAWAGQRAERLDDEVDERTCQSCHMQKEPAIHGDQAEKHGVVSSHRFAGAHTWLAAMRKDPAALAHESSMLRGALTIDVAALRHEDGRRDILPDGAAVGRGEKVILDVVARNTKVGHRFPGGVMDAADAWFEVIVRDAKGKVVASAGVEHETTSTEPTAHVLRAVQLDDDGKPVDQRETDRFRVVVTNHTIAARDAELAEYAFVVPENAALPLVVSARLRHRTRSLAVQALACDALARGTPDALATTRAFAAAEAKLDLRSFALDPCARAPITEIAETELVLGGAHARDPSRDFRRAYDYALGLSHVLQERLDEGREAIALARAAAQTPRERAMATALLAFLAAREGRPTEALALADVAETDAEGHPFLLRVRGEALAEVWRFDEAAPWLERAAQRAPLDDTAWSRLAVVLGSANHPRAALAAAARTLVLFPRDADALRVQSLSLDALGAPLPECNLARAAFLDRHAPDDGPSIKGKCSATVPGCALERDPVHVHAMKQ
ncbi:hypothetical protein BH09MYX1_BH09MYX1_53190 [soil metagenome]